MFDFDRETSRATRRALLKRAGAGAGACLLAGVGSFGLLPRHAVAASPSTILYNAATRSYYKLLLRGELTWQQAYDVARGTTHKNRQGRLASITSYDEDRFLIASWGTNLLNCWLGAIRRRGMPPGPWTWTSGESFSYTNWARGENNNTAGKEDTIQYWPGGSILGIGWADISQNANQARGLVIEYPR